MEVGGSSECFDTSGMGEEKTLLLGRIVCLNCWHSSSAVTTKGIRLLHTHTHTHTNRRREEWEERKGDLDIFPSSFFLGGAASSTTAAGVAE